MEEVDEPTSGCSRAFSAGQSRCLDEVSDVGGQLLHDGVVEPLDVLEHALVLLCNATTAARTDVS